MSFSSVTKDELTTLKLKGESASRAALLALTKTAGSLIISNGSMAIQYTTESYSVAKFTSKLASRLYAVEASVAVTEKTGRAARNVIVTVEGSGCAELISDSGLFSLDEGNAGIDPARISGDTDKIAFVRGAFLGAGSVNEPTRGYNLEIVCRETELSKLLIGMLSEHGIAAKTRKRKETHVLYIKDADMISGFLALMGASDAALRLEEVRTLKSISNNINRVGNCDVANMQKTAETAAIQSKSIELIAKVYGLERLPNELRQIAEARLNNREASLTSLAEELEIGRSAVNYRLQKLMKLAEELRFKYGEGS